MRAGDDRPSMPYAGPSSSVGQCAWQSKTNSTVCHGEYSRAQNHINHSTQAAKMRMSRPIRRVLSHRSGGSHPSTTCVAARLQRPTRMLGRAALERILSGLAPGGVYPAAPVAGDAGELLPHRFTLTAPVARGGGLLSVALARGSPQVVVSHHPALRSPDVPRRRLPDDAAAWPTHPPYKSTRRGTPDPVGFNPHPRGRRAPTPPLGAPSRRRPSARRTPPDQMRTGRPGPHPPGSRARST